MTSYSRLELANKFKQDIADWEAKQGPVTVIFKPMDSVHIQMASVDEMMSAYGYAPRRLPNYPGVTDGRFGYYLVNPHASKAAFMAFEDAVRMHNGDLGFISKTRAARRQNSIGFARDNRIVEQVSLQRTKNGGLIAQTKWVKFCDVSSDEYFGIPFDDGLTNPGDE